MLIKAFETNFADALTALLEGTEQHDDECPVGMYWLWGIVECLKCNEVSFYTWPEPIPEDELVCGNCGAQHSTVWNDTDAD